MRPSLLLRLIVAVVALAAVARANAEVSDVTIADQFGIAYLPLLVMQEQRLIEKQAAADGLGAITVHWAKFGGAGTINDALLSGSINIGVAGIPSLLLLWDKTKGTADAAIGICAINNTPMYLNTRDPKIRTLQDFTAAGKIAVPSVRVSIQAIALEIMAAETFGPDQYDKLDNLTVSMRHPDAMAALLSGAGDVTTHFASPPFMFQELEQPGIRRIISSKDVVGDTSFVVAYVMGKFYESNPKVVSAFVAATKEAMAFIEAHKEDAAALYAKRAGMKEADISSIVKMLNDPDLVYSPAPTGIMKYAHFMRSIGRLKSEPVSWKDMFIPAVHELSGS